MMRTFLLAILLLAGVLVVGTWDRATASSFDPSSTHNLSDSGAGAGADVTITLNIPSPDANFERLAFFTPPEWGVATDGDVVDGALVGDLSAGVTIGALNGGCSSTLGANLKILEATTDTGTTIPFADPDFDTPGDLDDQFDVDADGLPLGATLYPDYLTRSFAGLTPMSRFYGQTVVATVDVSFNFLTFEPGTVFQTPGGEVKTDPRLGYVSVAVLQNAGDPELEPSLFSSNAISDLCTSFNATLTIFGTSQDNPATAANESGMPVRTNAGAGSYNFVAFAVSQPDADDDGWENALDPCPLDVEPGWDPRAAVSAGQPGDTDGDRLPDACDPDPLTPSPTSGGLHDEDLDLYANRGDNCPLVANGTVSGPDNQRDSDTDGIGDACDPSPNAPDGHSHSVCRVSTVDVGGGGPPPEPDPQTVQPCDPNAPLPNCGGIPATMLGTSGDDILVGTAGTDVIVAFEGNDLILGRAGNDLICAGIGADVALGGPGRDIILGGAGGDTLDGGPGFDICHGGGGTDAAARCEWQLQIP